MNIDTVKNSLREYICSHLLRDPEFPLTDTTPLLSSHLVDSLSLAQIAVFIEETFGIYIPDPDLTVAKMDTLRQMAERVMRQE